MHGAAYHLCGRLGLLGGFNRAERELLKLIKDGTTVAHLKEIIGYIDSKHEVGRRISFFIKCTDMAML